MDNLHITYAGHGYAIVTSGDTSDTLPIEAAMDKFTQLTHEAIQNF